jgi:hypothetical protein
MSFLAGDPVDDYTNYIGMIPGSTTFVQTMEKGGELEEVLVGLQVRGGVEANSQGLEIAQAVAGAVDSQIETWVGNEFNYVFENQDKNYSSQEAFDRIESELYFEQMMGFSSLSLYLSYRDRDPVLPRPMFKVDF